MKRAQQSVGMSFGMIFSIFLIVIFIVFAGIAINFFLGVSRTVSVGSFYEDLQREVDNVWRSQASQKTFEINLPDKITKVCFANLSSEITGSTEDYDEIERYFVYEANTFLIPTKEAEGFEYHNLKHINLPEIIKSKNPNCFDSKKDLTLKKDFYDKEVIIYQ